MAAFRGVFHVVDHGVMAPRAPSTEHAISNRATPRPWEAMPYSITLIQLLKTIGCPMLYNLSILSSTKRSREKKGSKKWKKKCLSGPLETVGQDFCLLYQLDRKSVCLRDFSPIWVQSSRYGSLNLITVLKT